MTQKLKITQQTYSSKEKIPENATLKQLMHIANLLGVELVSLLPDEKKELQKKLPASLSAAEQMFGKNNEKDYYAML